MESLNRLKNYEIFAKNRNSSGGGVLLYVNSVLKPSIIEDFSVLETHFESLFLNLTYDGHHVIVGNIYRPPSQ